MYLRILLFLVFAGPSSARYLLDSVFISVDSATGASTWNSTRWEQTFSDLAAIKVHNVILANAVTEKTAHYPTKIPGLSVQLATTVIDCLTAAEKHGASVYIGVILRDEWFKVGATNITYLKQLLDISNQVATELHELYGNHRTFRGMYNTAEVWSTCCFGPCNSTLSHRLATTFLEPFGAHVHSLNPLYKHVIAPFYINTTSLDHEMAFWKTIFANTPSLDLVLFQDGVGVQHVTGPHQAMDYLRPLQKLATQYPNIVNGFGTDVEIFIKHPHYKVAPSARVEEQLTLEGPITSYRTCWEYSHYLDPRGTDYGNQSKRLYDDYKKWCCSDE